MRHEIDINDRNTLVNHPNPVPEWFQQGLKAIDKTLRCVWGQSELVFACGRYIPKYRSGVVREDRITHFRLRNIVTDESTECSFHTAKRRWELTQEKDFKDDFIRSEKYDEINLEPIGLPRFVVEQYFPADRINDTPDNWERHRYMMFSPHPAIEPRMTDIIGPFPCDGRYEGFYVIKEDDGTKFGKYRPVGQDILDEIARLVKVRNTYKQTKPDELVVRDMFDLAAERDRQAEAELTDRLVSEIKPHVFTGLYMREGDPHKMNKHTKHGRSR